jgi:hypothetical protein
MANEPLTGKRVTKVMERKTKSDWAQFVRELTSHYEKADKITLVLDNLSTHKRVPSMKSSLRKKPNPFATA